MTSTAPQFAGPAVESFAVPCFTAVVAVTAHGPWGPSGRGIEAGFASGLLIQAPASVAIGAVESGRMGRTEIAVENSSTTAVVIERIE